MRTPRPSSALAAAILLAASALAQQPDQGTSDQRLHSRGRELFLAHRCTHCHQSPKSDWSSTAPDAPDLRNAGSNLDPAWVAEWLADGGNATASVPHGLRGDSAARDARDIAAWLAKAGGKPFQRRALERTNKRGAELFVTRGCAACHTEADATKDSRHHLPDLAHKTGADQLAEFLQSPERRWPNSRMPDLQLSRNDARAIAEALCFGDSNPEAKQPTGDPIRGETLVDQLGCANCHRLPGKRKSTKGPALAKLATRSVHGCLSTNPHEVNAPAYTFDDGDRDALRAFVRQPNQTEPEHLQLERRLNSLRCLSCHVRDDRGGMPEALRAEFHRLCDEDAAELMDPPALTALEQRLRPRWVEDVLTDKTRGRPYLALRMPHYAKSQTAGLASLWFDRDTDPVTPSRHSLDSIEHGRQIIGSTGLSCIICHDFRGQRGIGSHGPDFTAMHRRLQPAFLRKWIRNPQAIDPGTRMPTFFQAGKSSALHILDGDANAQIDAIVAYLAQGDRMTAPVGLAPPADSILVVDDRLRIMRTILPDLGPRSIALGFPGGLSATLDLGTPRLGYVWLGGFLDMSRKWTGRGNGPATLIGERVLDGPPGSMFRRGNLLANARLRGYERAQHSIAFRFLIDDREDATLELRSVRSPAGTGLELALTSASPGLELALGLRRDRPAQPTRHWLEGATEQSDILALGSIGTSPIGKRSTLVLRTTTADSKATATLWFLTDSSKAAIERLEQRANKTPSTGADR